jgi:hypothetical protein
MNDASGDNQPDAGDENWDRAESCKRCVASRLRSAKRARRGEVAARRRNLAEARGVRPGARPVSRERRRRRRLGGQPCRRLIRILRLLGRATGRKAADREPRPCRCEQQAYRQAEDDSKP